MLPSCKQEASQTPDQFPQMKLLDRGFKSVRAEQNQNDAIFDVFFIGMQSNSIRQRFLENKMLDVDSAYENGL